MLVNFDRPRPLFDPAKLYEYGVVGPERAGVTRAQEIGLPSLGGLFDNLQTPVPQMADPAAQGSGPSGLDAALELLRKEQGTEKDQLIDAITKRGQLKAPVPVQAKPVGQGQLNTGLIFGTLAAALGANQDVVLNAFSNYANGLKQLNQQKADEANQIAFTDYTNTANQLNAQMEGNRLLYGMTTDEIDKTSKAIQKWKDDADAILKYQSDRVNKLTDTFLDLRAKGQLTTGILTSLQESVARNGGSLVSDQSEWESVYHEAEKNSANIDQAGRLNLQKLQNDIRADDDAHQAALDTHLVSKEKIEQAGYDTIIKRVESHLATSTEQDKIDYAKAQADKMESESRKAAIEEKNLPEKLRLENERTRQLTASGWRSLQRAEESLGTAKSTGDYKGLVNSARSTMTDIDHLINDITTASKDDTKVRKASQVTALQDRFMDLIGRIPNEATRKALYDEAIARGIVDKSVKSPKRK